VAAGCTAELQAARFGVETALAAYAGDWQEVSTLGIQPMPDGPMVYLFWRFVDAVDDWILQLRMCIVDAICGPEPLTAADKERAGNRDRMR
jgi:hypothetical protein